jgi:hypothetical protein
MFLTFRKRSKILYNPEVRFKNRMYLDFHLSIKKVKLRESLTKIMGNPDIYLRSKVPADIFDTIQKLAEMRKYDRIKYLRDYNLFATSERLLALERKYGDSLSNEDLYGVKDKVKKKKSPPKEEEHHTSAQESPQPAMKGAMKTTSDNT